MCRSLNYLPIPQPLSQSSYSAVELAIDNDSVWMLDQRQLPQEQLYWEYRTVEQVACAIKQMVVRGAPAIGIAAAYAMVLAARQCAENTSDYVESMNRYGTILTASRPTAVNLLWAVQKCLRVVQTHAHKPMSPSQWIMCLADLAREIHRQDVQACRNMGKLGASRIADGATILTHCNAGALATGGYGTALGVVRAAREAGKKVRVFADETRPYLQGARLTAWELVRDGIEVTVIADNMAAHLLARGEVDAVVVGADRVASNGDVANKIGTYALACLAKMHAVPFYVAAPVSTIDFACASGDQIPIEQRDSQEVLEFSGVRIAPEGARALYPAFDVTPHHLISAIFTEIGVIDPVDANSVVALEKQLSVAGVI